MDGKTHEAKQLVVERVKQNTNILVTVENNPSVDELAAALAFTLMLNKMDKHATAVFSGLIPPAINFLEPSKTFEHTADSLRDFIIALDKDKADRLRYKVEDDLVKIFITPYQSKITEKDLQFSQGEFNVELVIALGVKNKDALDKAIAAHGRILHDAAVVTITAQGQGSSVGSVNWQDTHASSICEMLASLSETLEPKLLDKQMSTALLTGIVSATDRFSNDHTTPHTMTIAAELMAAGADQQLIATNLQVPPSQPSGRSLEGRIRDRNEPEPHPAHEGAILSQSRKVLKTPPKNADDDIRGEMKIRHGEPPVVQRETPKPPASDQPAPSTAPKPPIVAQKPPQPVVPAVPTVADELADLSKALDEAADQPTTAPKLTPSSVIGTKDSPASPDTIVKDSPAFALAPPPVANNTPAAEAFPKITPVGQHLGNDRPNYEPLAPPTLGGPLNAATAEAEEDNRKAVLEAQQHNNVTLSHGAPGGMQTAPMPPAVPASAPVPESSPAPPSQEDDLEAARRAIDDALNSTGSAVATEPSPPTSLPAPQSTPAPLPPSPTPTNSALPPMPDFSTLPPMPPMPGASMATPQGGSPLDALAPIASPGSNVTAQYAMPGAPAAAPVLPQLSQPFPAPAPGQVNPGAASPNQFRIPGQ